MTIYKHEFRNKMNNHISVLEMFDVSEKFIRDYRQVVADVVNEKTKLSSWKKWIIAQNIKKSSGFDVNLKNYFITIGVVETKSSPEKTEIIFKLRNSSYVINPLYEEAPSEEYGDFFFRDESKESLLGRFMAKCKEVAKDHNMIYDEDGTQGYTHLTPTFSGDKDFYLYYGYATGGMTGGSCWGDSPHPVNYSTPQIEMKPWDYLMEEFCPNMSIFQYKRFVEKLKIEEDSDYYNEYYGNRTDYVFYGIHFINLFKVMNEAGLFENEHKIENV